MTSLPNDAARIPEHGGAASKFEDVSAVCVAILSQTIHAHPQAVSQRS